MSRPPASALHASHPCRFAVAGLLALLAGCTASAPEPMKTATTTTTTAPGAMPAVRAYVDPATGELATPPPGISTSTETGSGPGTPAKAAIADPAIGPAVPTLSREIDASGVEILRLPRKPLLCAQTPAPGTPAAPALAECVPPTDATPAPPTTPAGRGTP